MFSAFPDALDDFSTGHEDNVAEAIAAQTINELADAVNKIEPWAKFGLDPVAVALGMVAWTHDPQEGATSIQDTTGSMHGAAIALPKGVTISTLGTFVVTAGAGMTVTQFALLDSTFNALAITPNSAALAQTVGYREANLAAPFTTTYSGLYYLADLYAGTTMPFILRANAMANTSLQSQLPTSKYRIFNGGGPFGTFPATVTPSTSGAQHFLYAR